jgi:Ca-activated chloride channel family protein
MMPELFHFLRPWWFLMMAPLVFITWSLLRRQDPRRSWEAIIAPDLLEHLAITNEERRSRARPLFVIGALWLLSIVALAGPAWEKEATPFSEDESALFIVLKVTDDMLAEDIQPSRLQRSAQKIADLLALRPGSKTGLIAYAGSAHLVMPLTSDSAVIEYFASELSPQVMPLAGDDVVAAVGLAQRRLRGSGLPGSIVLIADQVDRSSSQAMADARDARSADVHILAMAAGPEVVPPAAGPPAPALDEDSMKQAARAGGGELVLVTADDADVRRLNAGIGRSIAAAPVQEGERWKDAGYYLLIPILLLGLLFFRPGGAVALQR